jgi:hypothetical protein
MADYKLTNSDIVIRTADSAFIPADPANVDYAKYLEWADIEGNVADPADPPFELTWDGIRAKRNALIAATDWVALPDCPYITTDPSKHMAYMTYRQALRDVPETFATPAEVVWPTKP